MRESQDELGLLNNSSSPEKHRRLTLKVQRKSFYLKFRWRQNLEKFLSLNLHQELLDFRKKRKGRAELKCHQSWRWQAKLWKFENLLKGAKNVSVLMSVLKVPTYVTLTCSFFPVLMWSPQQFLGGRHNAVLGAAVIGCRSFALFLWNQRTWNAKPLDMEIAERFWQNMKVGSFLNLQGNYQNTVLSKKLQIWSGSN